MFVVQVSVVAAHDLAEHLTKFLTFNTTAERELVRDVKRVSVAKLSKNRRDLFHSKRGIERTWRKSGAGFIDQVANKIHNTSCENSMKGRKHMPILCCRMVPPRLTGSPRCQGVVLLLDAQL